MNAAAKTSDAFENAVAAFNFNSPVCADTIVNFTDASTGALKLWTWTFYDGSTETTQNASFVFDSAGTFQVQLAVEDSFCLPDDVTQTVDVLPLGAPLGELSQRSLGRELVVFRKAALDR